MSDSHLMVSVPSPGPEAALLLREIDVDLRRAGVVCAPVRSGSTSHAKGGAGALTSLVVSGLLSAAGLRALSQVLVAVVRRSERRRIEIRVGDEVLVLDGASARDGRAAVDGFLDRVGGSTADDVA